MRVLYPVFRWWELAAGWRDTTLRMGVEEFSREIRQRLLVQRELALEGTIRDALALPEERDDLIQDGIKVHARRPLPVAVRVGTRAHVS